MTIREIFKMEKKSGVGQTLVLNFQDFSPPF